MELFSLKADVEAPPTLEEVLLGFFDALRRTTSDDNISIAAGIAYELVKESLGF